MRRAALILGAAVASAPALAHPGHGAQLHAHLELAVLGALVAVVLLAVLWGRR